MEQNQTGIRNLFQGILGWFGSEPPSQKTDTPADPLLTLDQALSALKNRAEELEESDESEAVIAAAATDDESVSLDITLERVKSAILAAHQSMKTGITEKELNDARNFLELLDRLLDAREEGGCEQMLKESVVRRVLEECAPLAWDTLNACMERSGMKWPEPTGLPDWAGEKEREGAARREQNEAREAFILSPPLKIAHRMFGIVPVWKADYPEEGSALWQRLILQGVGFGIFARLLVATDDVLRGENSKELRSRIQPLLAERVQDVQKALRTGLASVEQADKLIGSASTLCAEVVPQMAWDAARPRIEQAIEQIRGGKG